MNDLNKEEKFLLDRIYEYSLEPNPWLELDKDGLKVTMSRTSYSEYGERQTNAESLDNTLRTKGQKIVEGLHDYADQDWGDGSEEGIPAPSDPNGNIVFFLTPDSCQYLNEKYGLDLFIEGEKELLNEPKEDRPNPLNRG